MATWILFGKLFDVAMLVDFGEKRCRKNLPLSGMVSQHTEPCLARNYDVLLNMNLKNEIDRHFAPILQEAGFERFDGPWLSYRKALPDIHYHVDVENHYYANSFSVTLQTVDRNGNRHTLDLAEFNDSHDFKYPGNSTVTADNTSNVANADETRAVLLVAFELLKTHGISWLLAISPA